MADQQDISSMAEKSRNRHTFSRNDSPVSDRGQGTRFQENSLRETGVQYLDHDPELYSIDRERTPRCTDLCWSEEDFIDRVEEYLLKEQYIIKQVKAIHCFDSDVVFPDFIAEKNGLTYYIEIKGCYHADRIQTGTGQLLQYQFHVNDDMARYLLIYPSEFKKHVDPNNEFSDYVSRLFKNKMELVGI